MTIDSVEQLHSKKGANFTSVTEVPGVQITQDELDHIITRYSWAAAEVEGCEVLELACGSGQGLGFLRRHGATRVVGTDIEAANLQHARDYYGAGSGVELDVVDAERLPYDDDSFDRLLLFEAIYYLPAPQQFLQEAARVLRPGGALFISTVNPDWPGFHPSAFSKTYPNAALLRRWLHEAGFKPSMRGGFPDEGGGAARRVIRLVRSLAARLRLFPDSQKGKERLKRFFYGPLMPMPNEIEEGMGAAQPLAEIDGVDRVGRFVFLYAKGVLPGKASDA